jgi:hypothetical protein
LEAVRRSSPFRTGEMRSDKATKERNGMAWGGMALFCKCGISAGGKRSYGVGEFVLLGEEATERRNHGATKGSRLGA